MRDLSCMVLSSTIHHHLQHYLHSQCGYRHFLQVVLTGMYACIRFITTETTMLQNCPIRLKIIFHDLLFSSATTGHSLHLVRRWRWRQGCLNTTHMVIDPQNLNILRVLLCILCIPGPSLVNLRTNGISHRMIVIPDTGLR